jgi:hypothetical protein
MPFVIYYFFRKHDEPQLGSPNIQHKFGSLYDGIKI